MIFLYENEDKSKDAFSYVSSSSNPDLSYLEKNDALIWFTRRRNLTIENGEIMHSVSDSYNKKRVWADVSGYKIETQEQLDKILENMSNTFL